MSESRPAARPVEEVVDAVAENQRFSSANQKSEISGDVDGSELPSANRNSESSGDVAITADERDRVREALDPITEEDRITHEAVERAVSDTAKLVATAETRTELAGIAYDDATAAAADVRDLPTVAARLESYEQRLAAVEERAAALGGTVPKPTDMDPETLHETALALREAATSAQGVARTADDLSWDLEQFESWLDDAARRHDELREDVALVEEAVADLAERVAGIDATDEPAVAWADATVQARVLDLLVADLQAELADLQTLAERRGEEVPEELSQRVAALDREVGVVSTRLADRGEAAWRERFAAELNASSEGLSGLEPPVDWGRVDEVASEQREAIGVE